MERVGPYDVVVVGSGNAALCAAPSAREHGATVALLERAPEEERGGGTAMLAPPRTPPAIVKRLRSRSRRSRTCS